MDKIYCLSSLNTVTLEYFDQNVISVSGREQLNMSILQFIPNVPIT